MPTWFGSLMGVSSMSAAAYSSSLSLIVVGIAISLIPIFLLQDNHLTQSEKSIFAPFAYMRKNPGVLSRLILPMLITSIGAGLIMPFMNVFFRNVHNQSDSSIGILFAWGSLAMGAGLMVAPILAERYGKIQVVVVSQALSIPFLAMLGFSPWFSLSAIAYYIRLALMNMSSPVYQTL